MGSDNLAGHQVRANSKIAPDSVCSICLDGGDEEPLLTPCASIGSRGKQFKRDGFFPDGLSSSQKSTKPDVLRSYVASFQFAQMIFNCTLAYAQ